MRRDLNELAAASREALMAEWRGRRSPSPKAFEPAPDGADPELRLSAGNSRRIYKATGWQT